MSCLSLMLTQHCSWLAVGELEEGKRGPVQVAFDSFNIGLQLYSVSVCLEKTLNSKDLMHLLTERPGWSCVFFILS